MGGKKNTTTNDYGFFTPPKTEELSALEAWQPQADPTIPYNFAKQKEDFNASFKNPLGPYTTPEMQRQMTQAGNAEIGQNEAQAFRGDQYNQNNLKLGQLGMAAQLRNPRLENTKSTTQQSGGFWRDLAMGAAGAGAAFI